MAQTADQCDYPKGAWPFTRAPRGRYLADVLARINDHMNPKLDELLPWNWKSTGQTEVKAA
jgi:hypothetical protein